MRARSVLVALALGSAACGPVVTTSETIPPTTSTLASTTTLPATTTTPTVVTTSTSATTSTTLPITLTIGDDWDGELLDFGPQSGSRMAVVGVRFNDVLNVREGPGPEFPVLTILQPTEDRVLALGLTWANPTSIWYAVEFGDVQGWASAAFLLLPGEPADITGIIVDRLGFVPESGSLIELGETVAGAMASDEPRSAIEQPAPVVIGTVGEMVIDVIGLGDDSVGGFRLRVLADDEDGTWVLNRVEGMPLCSRGVQQGRCV